MQINKSSSLRLKLRVLPNHMTVLDLETAFLQRQRFETMVDSGVLATVYPDGVTDELCEGFTLKSGITGGEFYNMDSIAINLDGYLVDAEEGDDPDAVWAKLGQ